MDSNLPTDDNNKTIQNQTSPPGLVDDQQAQDQNTSSQQPISQKPPAKKPPYQAQQPSVSKEQKEAFGATFKEEELKVIEEKEFEPSKEVADWMEKIEGEEITLPQPIRDDYGQILVQAARITKPKIVLPATQQKIQKGLHHKVADSIKWLAEWCLRLIKMFPERIIYPKTSVKKLSTQKT